MGTDPLVGATIAPYRILSKLGEGGMGEVYLAEDSALGRRVAIKFLPESVAADDSAIARFQREARAAASLEHPGIVSVHHAGSFQGRPYIVIALAEGRTLDKILADGPMATERAASVARQVAEALTAAHRAGVVHRDIKPSNIIVDADGHARILDFGLAKLEGAETLTADHSTLGTARYMSPEQVRGEETDARTDLFSLGAILYEMLAGRPPFRGEHREAIFYAILNESPAPPLRAGDPAADALAGVAMRALSKDRNARFATAADMSHAMEGVRASRAATPRRGRWMWPAVALLIIALLYFMARSGGRDTGRTSAGAPLRIIGFTTSQLTFSVGVEEWPAWSPDGASLLYAAEVDGFRRLVLRDLATNSDRALTSGRQDDIQPAWSPDGRTVAFTRAVLPSGRLAPSDVLGFYFEGGDIFLLDVATGEAAQAVVDAFNPAYSPDGSRLAFDARRAGTRRIWATDTRGRNPEQLTTDASEAVNHVKPRWSPDGGRIVYRRLENTRADIEMIDLATRRAVRLTNDGFNDLDPVWSPDGRHVYFSSYRGGGLNIWRVAVGAGGASAPEQVTTGAGDDVQPALSPDGNRLAFAVLGLNSDLWTIPLDPASGAPAGEPRALVATTREDSRGAWSPDGMTIAFNSDRAGDMNIWLRQLDDGVERQLTKGPGGDYQADWSPDGRSIVFFSSRSGNADLWRVDVASGDSLLRLTDHEGLDINPFYSPDGARIAFMSDRGGRSELWVMNADGSGQRRVADAEASGHFVRWFDGGRRIIFASGDGSDRVIRAADVASGALETMRSIASGAHMSFSPDETRILETAGHRVLWVYTLSDGSRAKVLEFPDPDIRVDYPVWSPDGRHAVFDRVAPRGGDIWVLEGLANGADAR